MYRRIAPAPTPSTGVPTAIASLPSDSLPIPISPARRKSVPKAEIGERLDITEEQHNGEVILKVSSVSPKLGPVPDHHRMASPLIEVEEQEDYFKSIKKSYGEKEIKLEAVEKVLVQWLRDLKKKPTSNNKQYNRMGLLSALQALRKEIHQDKALLLLEQLKKEPSKKVKEEILNTLSYLQSVDFEAVVGALNYLELALKAISSTSIELTKLPAQVSTNHSRANSRVSAGEEDKSIPGLMLPSEGGNHLADVYFSKNKFTLEEKLERKENHTQPWYSIFKLVSHANDMLYNEFVAQKASLDPRPIFAISLLPKKLRLACVVRLAINQSKKPKSSCFGCCNFFLSNTILNRYYELLATINVESTDPNEVIRLENALKNIANYLVLDNTKVLDKHLRFGSSSETMEKIALKYK